jgi:hypothetical protein
MAFAITTWNEKPELPPIPKVVPGYFVDLLARLKDRTKIPPPKGWIPGAVFTVSRQATHEMYRLNDVSVLDQVREFLGAKKWDLSVADDVAAVLVALFKNTQSAQAEKLLFELLISIEKKKKAFASAFWFIGIVNAPSLREIALRHLTDPNDRVTGASLEILAGVGDARDSELITELFSSGKFKESTYQSVVHALVATGKERAVPVLQNFIRGE